MQQDREHVIPAHLLHARLAREPLSRALRGSPGALTQTRRWLGEALSVGVWGGLLGACCVLLPWMTIETFWRSPFYCAGFLWGCFWTPCFFTVWRRRLELRRGAQVRGFAVAPGDPTRRRALGDLLYHALAWTRPLLLSDDAPVRVRLGTRYGDVALSMTLRGGGEATLMMPGACPHLLRVLVHDRGHARARWSQDRRVSEVKDVGDGRVAVALLVELRDAGSIARVGRLAAEVMSDAARGPARGERLSWVAGAAPLEASCGFEAPREARLPSSPERAVTPPRRLLREEARRRAWAMGRHAALCAAAVVVMGYAVLVVIAALLGEGARTIDDLMGLGLVMPLTIAVFHEPLLRPVWPSSRVRRSALDLWTPPSSLLTWRDGHLRLEQVAINLTVPFTVALTRHPEARGDAGRVTVALHQRRGDGGVARLALAVDAAGLEDLRLLSYLSDAPVVPADAFADWVWPTILNAATLHARSLPWRVTRTAIERGAP